MSVRPFSLMLEPDEQPFGPTCDDNLQEVQIGRKSKMHEATRPSGLVVLGWLYLVANTLFFGVGIVAYFFLTGIGEAIGGTLLWRILEAAGQASFLFFTLLAMPGLLTGLALLQGRPWARSLAWAVALLHLLNFPLGTLLSVYTFRVLPEVERRNEVAALKPA
jgi:heme/copper-type cytochrome/quinol oxidase subunit 3